MSDRGTPTPPDEPPAADGSRVELVDGMGDDAIPQPPPKRHKTRR